VTGSEAAALMDVVYRRQRHIYDLTRKYFLFGRDRLIRALDPPPGGSVLEIGCGTARNLILAARAYPAASCHGLDISREMLATAERNVARAGLGPRLRLAEGDAAGFDPEALFGRRRFDRVFISYSLSMIPAWQQALEQAAAVLRPGGRLHVVDFGQQERLPGWFRRLLFGWIGRFHVEPRAELERVLADIAARTGASLSFRVLMRGYAWYAELRC
jgi:S-adenosylmethionine-diacylgycerolhomoserine-N-methlytransferase